MPLGHEPVALGQAKIIRKSDKAICVRIGKDEHWIPLSVLHDDSEVFFNDDDDYGDEGELVVKAWFAEKEGLV